MDYLNQILVQGISNNYNQIETHFENSFQHGGVSLEEMMLPFILLKPK